MLIPIIGSILEIKTGPKEHMEIDITIRNYRCFPDDQPARIVLRNGFTAFLGVNNSGKSSFLKFFFEFRDLFNRMADIGTLSQALGTDGLVGFNLPTGFLDREELFSDSNKRDLTIEFLLHDIANQRGTIRVTKVVITVLRMNLACNVQLLNEKNEPVEFNRQTTVRTEAETLVNQATRVDVREALEIAKALGDTLYIGPFRNVINVGAAENYFDIHVGQAFVKAWKDQKTGMNKQRRESTQRVASDIKHLFGYSQLDINSSADEKSLQVFLDGKSYDVKDVGSGLTQFILALANAATRSPRWILIDEPELNLHPSLQLDFLTTLASNAVSGVVFATHSYGLARAIANHIYSFRRIKHGQSEIKDLESTPRMSEFLGELSFSGYKELGFDKILLVEGPHDVTMYQQFLRALKKDHKIVLLPMGGSQLINANTAQQLEEIKRISPNISALIDSERDSKGAALHPNRLGFVKACEAAEIECHVLERRAAENYLSDKAIKKMKGDKYRALGDFEARGNVNPIWPKAENWRIAREMQVDEIKITDLYEFLKKL